MIIAIFIDHSQHKTIKSFPTLALFKKGTNESLTYFGPRDLGNLVTYLNDATDFYARPPSKVRS